MNIAMRKVSYLKVHGKGVRALCALLMLSACSDDSGLSGKSSVWDSYDFRHPVPYGAPVPESRANTYDQYLGDYEQDYVPPRGYVAPAPAPTPYTDYEQYYVPPRGYTAPAPAQEFNRNYNPCIPGDPGCIAGR